MTRNGIGIAGFSHGHYQLLCLLSLLLFFVFLVVPPGGGGELFVDSLVSVFIIITIGSIAESKREAVIGLALGLPVIVSSWIDSDGARFIPLLVLHAFLPILFSFFFFHLVRKLLRDTTMTGNHLAGCIAAYFQLGFCFASLFHFLNLLLGGTFVQPGGGVVGFRELILFSFMTLSTSSGVPVSAVSSLALGLAVFEAVCGQLFLAVFVGQIVGLFIGQKLHRNE